MTLKKMVIFLLAGIFQLSASIKQDRLTDMLYQDFNEFTKPKKQLSEDEFLFRAMCFTAAAAWTLKIWGAEETFDNYIAYFTTFFGLSQLTLYFDYKYFGKNPSISRELFVSAFFLTLRKVVSPTTDEFTRDIFFHSFFNALLKP